MENRMFINFKEVTREDIERELVEEEGIDKKLLRDFMGFLFSEMRYYMNNTDSIRVRFSDIGFFKFKPLVAVRKAEEVKTRIRKAINSGELKDITKSRRINRLQKNYEFLTNKINKHDAIHKKNTRILYKYGKEEYLRYLEASKSGFKDYELPNEYNS